ncbi:hypothetical protein L1S32_09840 [Methanogenium sp. S4BF]|uniref:hypothetical protein n=1 Tax=Methanogenium sp. S4BF TaxID=1789226 RepID=UPI0024176FE8|nr:hypothetical protein [Methanogenium sp. S4BF]WFN34142.1 hypothetical protein L1S32_09840 [Methanogenium sp. S4BF]
MENSRTGMVIMALPLLILVLALVIALYNAGFDVEAATLPENPAGPLNETLRSLLEADRPLVTGSAVEGDAAAGTATLKGSVANPTAYPLTVQHIEYRVPGDDGGFMASLMAPVTIAPGEQAAVVLMGSASADMVTAIKSGSVEGVLVFEVEIMGIGITTEMARPWKVGA